MAHQTVETQTPLIRSLSNPGVYDHHVESIRVIETHISWVLLTGDFVYKIKKPVRLPFVDFSTLEQRREFCEEELRLNRRLAPELYVDIVTIGGSVEEPTLGKQPAIEYAVRLRQFPDGARLDEHLVTSGIPPEDIVALAESIAEFHAALKAVPEYGSAEAIIDVVATNLDETRQALDSPAHARDLDTLGQWLADTCGELKMTLADRHTSGAIRECHGDLHLENLAYWHDRIVAFDALEFDPALRCIDVLDEAAFLVMDLLAHSEPGLAYEFLNRYLEVSGDYLGLPVFRLYLVHRALVRAKVAEIKLRQRLGGSDGIPEVADRYFRCALDAIRERAPRLLITHGLSGSGKTTVTSSLISRLPAIRCRSDLERKRLHGLAPDAHSGSAVGRGLYDSSSSEATYARLRGCAASALRAGLDVIVDAAFLRRSDRDAFGQLARDAGAAFALLDCQAPEIELRRRIEARQASNADASEATPAVLESQLETREPLSPEELERTVS
ncbi:MAG TPA: AAA family ATPase, partial [Gammaproteobacteria bacterium]